MNREVVVLRKGPPKGRGAVVDAIVGIVGVGLLVLAGVLGETLPEKDVIPTQYLPTYPINNQQALIRYGEVPGPLKFIDSDDDPTALGILREDDEVLIEFEVLHDNVFSVRIEGLIRGDDVPGSAADIYTFHLYDQDGNQLSGGTGDSYQTAPNRRQAFSPENGTVPLLVPVDSALSHLWRFRAAPDPEFITGGPNMTAVEAQFIASQRGTLPSKGTWSVVMQFRNAGDCPQTPGTTPEAAQTYAECQRNAQERYGGEPNYMRGNDFGNPLIFNRINYDYYTIEIQED